MNINEIVYQTLYKKNLFGKELNIVVNSLKKELKESKGVILAALNDLQNARRIGVKKDQTLYAKIPSKIAIFKETNSKSGIVKIDGQEFFIKNRETANNGDKVEVNFCYYKGRQEAFITNVVERNNKYLLGRIAKDGPLYRFIPDTKRDLDFYLPQTEEIKNLLGKKVSYEIKSITDKFVAGEIDKVFGLAGDPIVENQAIAYEYGFVKEFDEEVENEAKNISREITEEEINSRLDLRHIPFVTIDGADCKDKDDAVYVEKTENGYKVYVGIADVAHYIQKGSKLDNEAKARGTSCYLGDGVYPMYPELISNDICSLNEGEDKLSITTIIDIDNNGNVLNYDIQKTIIRIDKCLTYDIVEDVYEDKNFRGVDYQKYKDLIFVLYEVNKVLSNYRDKRGAIEFIGTEPSFEFNDLRTNVVNIVNKNNTESRKIIESLMVLANEVVGDFFHKNRVPMLYRIHDKPEAFRFQKTMPIFESFDAPYTGDLSQENIKAFLESIKGHKAELFLNDTMLRCMDKACYSPNNIGHFALASRNYIHFTSPIRRYPDTLVHRVLHELIETKQSSYSYFDMLALGEQCSNREYNATLAERRSDELLMTIWAENHINEIIDCKIYSMGKKSMKIKHGLISIEIPYKELPYGEAGYKISPTKTEICGIKNGKKYKIGDDIKVKILSADRKTRFIYTTTDFNKVLNVKPQNQTNENSETKTM